MKDKVLNVVLSLAVVLCICLFVYGSYWVAKNVSYSFFYEDMVQKTIKEMVKPEYLIDAI